jgi:Protein of unknown function (DUF1116)
MEDEHVVETASRMSVEAVAPGADAANSEVVRRMAAAQPVFVDIQLAGEVMPDMDRRVVLHAGPPIAYERMCPPMRSAVQAAVVYEGWAPDRAAANELLASGDVELAPCHSRQAVGTMTGIVSPSMPVFVLSNDAEPRNVAFGRVTEGFGKGLRFGAGEMSETIGRLQWVRDQLAPALQAGLRALPERRLPLRPLMAQALQMGDELHMRNAASTALLVKTLCGPLTQALNGQALLPEVLMFLTQGNDQFFLDMLMAAAKVIADAGRGVPGSSIVVCIARNGVEVGIQVSGLPGRWFTAPAEVAEGRFFPGFSVADANHDIGDSAITETVGLGNMAIAAAPAIVPFLGRSRYQEAQELTEAAYRITVGTDPQFLLAMRDFQGVPLGIDTRRVVALSYVPRIDTAIAPKDPTGGSIIGAGISRAPLGAFQAAVAALDESARQTQR